MNNRLHALRLFAEVARERSITRGADSLRLTRPSALKMIKDLEHAMGTDLLVRESRSITLTKAGETYLSKVVPVLDALDEANEAIRTTSKLRGKLRIGTTSAFVNRAVIPCVGGFIASNPQVELDFIVNDYKQDLIDDNLDIALRFGPLPDSGTVAKRAGAWPLMIAASPSYLERAGVPTSPGDLANHSAILFGAACTHEDWIFRKDGQKVSVKLAGQVKVSSSDTAIEAACAGLGIFRSLEPLFANAIRKGQLARVLPDWTMATVDVHALFPGAQPPKPSARAFVDYIAKALRASVE